MNKLNETNIFLQKKLNIEVKSYKQQLNTEIQKHKETQSQLNNYLNECKKFSSEIEVCMCKFILQFIFFIIQLKKKLK